jgi:F-type H+/Na+-transporting ATPase subunit alpha
MSLINQIKNDIENQTQSDFLNYKKGIVDSYSDGVIIVSGIVGLSYLEELEVFSLGNSIQKAIVLELENDNCKAVVLGDMSISAGSEVKTYGKILNLKIDPNIRGVVYDALGLIKLGEIEELSKSKLVELKIEDEAPKLMDREPVTRPLNTGILAIDTLANIGMGQRQLIIGDRQTGKTSITLDTILNQKGKSVTCIYVSIGQKQSSVSKIQQFFKDNKASEYTIIFSAPASSSVAMQYLVPFSAVSFGQYLMNKGEDVLIVYDDLSKHAVAWRQLSLLLKRPVGREAYPGDVFYLHSRLLERGGQLIEKVGGGSLTALPIIETLANDVTGYIPTNVISITDGQIYLEASLFNKGIRPAISAGLSVSRVGGAAQSKAIKKNGGKLKLELSQYRELASFSQIGSGLDVKTKQVLEHGAFLTNSLIQSNGYPLSYIQEVARLRIGNLKIDQGRIPNSKVVTLMKQLDEEVANGLFEERLSNYINNGKWEEEYGLEIDKVLNKFVENFVRL